MHNACEAHLKIKIDYIPSLVFGKSEMISSLVGFVNRDLLAVLVLFLVDRNPFCFSIFLLGCVLLIGCIL